MQGVLVIGLGARLRAAVELLPVEGAIADIGAGDGRLALHLARIGAGGPIFATEVHEGPWQHLVRGTADEPRIVCRYGDGLRPLRGERLRAAALLGMGPHTILEILQLHEEFPGCAFVLGPMQGAPRLRYGLRALGLTIVDERLARERGRFYPILRTERCGAPPPADALDDLLGPHLRHRRPAHFDEFAQRTALRLAGELKRDPQRGPELAPLLARLKEEYDAPR